MAAEACRSAGRGRRFADTRLSDFRSAASGHQVEVSRPKKYLRRRCFFLPRRRPEQRAEPHPEQSAGARPRERVALPEGGGAEARRAVHLRCDQWRRQQGGPGGGEGSPGGGQPPQGGRPEYARSRRKFKQRWSFRSFPKWPPWWKFQWKFLLRSTGNRRAAGAAKGRPDAAALLGAGRRHAHDGAVASL